MTTKEDLDPEFYLNALFYASDCLFVSSPDCSESNETQLEFFLEHM